MKRDEIARILFNNISIVEPYPDKVVKIDDYIEKIAFFPGGLGVLPEENNQMIPEILILGHDFSTVKEFIKLKDVKIDECNDPTWRNMNLLFSSAGINMKNCFFSNVFMGLRDTESMTGKFPGYKDKEFVNRCIEFLKYQVEIVKPKAIITLGKYAPEMLSKTSVDLNVWKNFNALKSTDYGFVSGVNIGGAECSCVALVHPSMRNSNVHRRKYKLKNGNEAEIEMLKELVKELK